MEATAGVGWEHLPTAIWMHIAGHLSRKDWVRISRACRAMQGVQPRVIRIEQMDAWAFKWLHKHWHCAKVSDISCKAADMHRLIPDHAAMPSFSSTRVLKVDVDGEIPAPAHKSSWVATPAAVLELLISCCKGLTLLWVTDQRAFREFVLPPVSTLRHLILDVQHMETSALASIEEMKLLKTLLLGPSFCYKDCSPPMCEVLDLSRLPKLKHVSIRLCYVRDSKLPHNAAVSVTDLAKKSMSTLSWYRLVEGRHVRTITCFSEKVTESPFVPSSGCKNIFWMHYRAHSAYAFAAFDGQSFRNLRELYVTQYAVQMYLASSLQSLVVLHVHAEQDLTVTCDDYDILAGRLREVSFCWEKGDFPMTVLDFVSAMAAQGKRMLRIVNVANAHHLLRCGMFYGRHCWRGEKKSKVVWPCGCGACINCIYRMKYVGASKS
jgi:hypothetical protein